MPRWRGGCSSATEDIPSPPGTHGQCLSVDDDTAGRRRRVQKGGSMITVGVLLESVRVVHGPEVVRGRIAVGNGSHSGEREDTQHGVLEMRM